MNPFVIILRPTIEQLPVNTQEARHGVYRRARQTVARRLAAINPQPSEDEARRQMEKLEEAIGELERVFGS